MGLRSRFKTESKKVSEGVWFDFPMDENKDGTIPRFKLARMSKQNRDYALSIRRASKGLSDDDLKNDESGKGDLMLLNVFVNTILKDWENFEPFKDDDKVAFSNVVAKELFGDDNWLELYDDLMLKSQKLSNYTTDKLEKDAKN